MATVSSTYTNNNLLSGVTSSKVVRDFSSITGFSYTNFTALTTSPTVNNISLSVTNNGEFESNFSFTYIIAVRFDNVVEYVDPTGGYTVKTFNKLYKFTGEIKNESTTGVTNYNLWDVASNKKVYYVEGPSTWSSGLTYDWLDLDDYTETDVYPRINTMKKSVVATCTIVETHFSAIENDTYYNENGDALAISTTGPIKAVNFSVPLNLNSTSKELSTISLTVNPITYTFNTETSSLVFSPLTRTTGATNVYFTGHTTTFVLKPYKDTNGNDFPNWCYNDILDNYTVSGTTNGSDVTKSINNIEYTINVSSPGCTFYIEKNNGIGSTPYNTKIIDAKNGNTLKITPYGEVDSMGITYHVCLCEDGYDGSTTTESNGGFPFIIFPCLSTNVSPQIFFNGTSINFSNSQQTIDGYTFSNSTNENCYYGSECNFTIQNAPVGGFSNSVFNVGRTVSWTNYFYKPTGNITIRDISSNIKLLCIHYDRNNVPTSTDNSIYPNSRITPFEHFIRMFVAYYHKDLCENWENYSDMITGCKNYFNDVLSNRQDYGLVGRGGYNKTLPNGTVISGTSRMVQYTFEPDGTGTTYKLSTQTMLEFMADYITDVEHDKYPYVALPTYEDGQGIMLKDILLGKANGLAPTVFINNVIASKFDSNNFGLTVNWTENSNDYTITKYEVKVATDANMQNVILTESGYDNAIDCNSSMTMTTLLSPVQANVTYYTQVTIYTGNRSWKSNVVSAKAELNSYIITSNVTTDSVDIDCYALYQQSGTITVDIVYADNIVYTYSFPYTAGTDYYKYSHTVDTSILPDRRYTVNMKFGSTLLASTIFNTETPQVDLVVEYNSNSTLNLFNMATYEHEYKQENIINSFKYVKITDDGAWNNITDYLAQITLEDSSTDNTFNVYFSMDETVNTQKAIHHSVFSYNNYVKTVTIPETSRLTSIGRAVFSFCFNLTDLFLNNNDRLISIGKGAFQCCERLQHVNLPQSLQKIGHDAFLKCINMDSYSLCASLNRATNSLTYIGKRAFERAGKEFRNIPLIKPQIKAGSVTFNALQYLGDSAFYFSYLFGHCNLGYNCKHIGAYAFGNCNSINSIDLHYDFNTNDHYYYPGILSRSEISQIYIHEYNNTVETRVTQFSLLDACRAIINLDKNDSFCTYNTETGWARFAFLIGNISNLTPEFGPNGEYNGPIDAYEEGEVQNVKAVHPRGENPVPSITQTQYGSATYMMYKCFVDTPILREYAEVNGYDRVTHQGQQAALFE